LKALDGIEDTLKALDGIEDESKYFVGLRYWTEISAGYEGELLKLVVVLCFSWELEEFEKLVAVLGFDVVGLVLIELQLVWQHVRHVRRHSPLFY